MEEIWKDVTGYEDNYQVSNLGNVRSKDCIHIIKGYERRKKGKLLKACRDSNGYYTVRLYKNGKAITHGLHKVVAITFLNHIPNGSEKVIDHIDNNKSNNKLSNIQIITTRLNSSKDIKNKTSKYTGVHLSKYGRKYKWKSTIVQNRKKMFLGYFNCETAGHIAYLKKVNEIEKQTLE